MTRNGLLLLSIVVFISYSCRQTKALDELRQSIEAELKKQKGEFAVAFKDLGSGETVFINEHELFHAASTMKTPVMIEVFKQAASGKFSLRDSVEIKNEFKSIADGSLFTLDPEDDSEQKLYTQIGRKKTWDTLVYDMIIVSSNLATNLIIDKVDAKNVMKTLREDVGTKEMEVLRGVEDQKAYEKGMNNSTSAYDQMLIFEKIAREEMINTEASQAMIKILLDQRFNDIIPAKLPKDVKVAHKTGWITGLHHDCGIVFLPDGRKYVLVLLSKKLEDEKASVDAMARVSEMIYNYEMKR